MTDSELPPHPDSPDREAQEESLGALLSRLAQDGRAYAEAEIDRQKVRAGIVSAGVRDIAILLLVALILLFGALVALMVGLVLALSPMLGPLGATGAVVGGALMIAVILALLARRRVKKIFGKGAS